MGWFDEQGTPDPATTYYVGDSSGQGGQKGSGDGLTNPATGQPWTEAELMAAIEARRNDPNIIRAFTTGGGGTGDLASRLYTEPLHQMQGGLMPGDRPDAYPTPYYGRVGGSSPSPYETGGPPLLNPATGQPYTDSGNRGPFAPRPGGGTPMYQSGGGGSSWGAMPGGTTGGYQPYSDQALQDILHKYPPTYDGVRAASVEVERTFGPNGPKLLDHPTKLDKFQLPDGRVVDTVIGAGGANPSWTWGVEGPGGGGGGAMGGVGGLYGNGITPQAQNLFNIAGQSYGAIGPLFGDPMAGKSLTDDPGFKFRLDEGRKALEASAAAKGTLLTGGMMKGLQRYGQDYASNEYQNSYARRASEQQNNYARLLGIAGFAGNEQQNQFGRILGTAQLGLNGTTAGQNMASGYAGNIGNAQMAQGNAAAAGTMAGAAGNANAINTLGGLAGQWMGGGYNSNGGDYLDYGRGLY